MASKRAAGTCRPSCLVTRSATHVVVLKVDADLGRERIVCFFDLLSARAGRCACRRSRGHGGFCVKASAGCKLSAAPTTSPAH